MSIKHRAQAYKELFSRYKAIFAHSWQNRHEFSKKIFNEQEAQFLPASLSLQEKPVSPASRFVAKILMLLVVTTLLWSIIGKVDIVVNSSGKIIPSERTKVISSADTASVKAIYIKDGQEVKSGDVLIELDTSAHDAEYNKANEALITAILQLERSRVLIEAIDSKKSPQMSRPNGVPDDKWTSSKLKLDANYRDFRSKIRRLNDYIENSKIALSIASKQAEDYHELSRHNDVSIHAWEEKERAKIDAQGRLTDTINQKLSLISEAKKLEYDAMTEATKVLDASKQDALRSQEHSRLLKLTTPVDGTVQQLSVHTIGAAVPAAQQLMIIVPKENQVEIEAFIENKDVGFVRVGQTAAVKIEAFEYTKYGTVSGKVVDVSKDAIQDEKRGLLYSVKVLLDSKSIRVEGKDVPLSVGMAARVEIKTGTRRVIEYVLSPLMQYKDESFHER